MWVSLDHHERRHAALVGVERHLSNAGRPDAVAKDGQDPWGQHIEGALAEFAVAKALNVHWSGVTSNPFVLPGDVGTLEIRSTPHSKGFLALYRKDPDDRTFVLVVADRPNFRYRLVGTIRARDGKLDQWWRDPAGRGRSCFCVPQEALQPLDALVM